MILTLGFGIYISGTTKLLRSSALAKMVLLVAFAAGKEWWPTPVAGGSTLFRHE